MTAKTFTLTAEIEYDPTATSVAAMSIPLHQLLENGFDVELLDNHGELFLHSCEVSDEPPKEGPSKLFDEYGNWTDYGHDLARRAARAIRPIAEECLKDGVDLRHAAFIVQQEASTAFLKVFMEKRVEPEKKS